ncbi:protein of unknown function [Saccharopolyspora kobensis]|uniref:DUF397 domain-containing protein n=1 Tax=Saccharopolyspora kobensis TaxID=146035 RepID=A0A1H6EKZ8_9PSEU|nr:DUF397 domain-containing protein [Saccharopolyspora kobensis]SEG98522.1 protein of unknown function [Saccharopolyspora kobensis]SFF26135.1 protein of unknown function [Saccharopolyspora kobensis]
MQSVSNWRKSSYSGEETNCVEVGWRKSSYSGEEGNCVEVGASSEVVGVRDTKDRDGGMLVFSVPVWGGFLRSLKAERFG